ncbi:MAG: peptide ABC transporter ATP-binding protein, partial [Tissierellales bacterium]|nr:peptide ABC transporter ATP-binding protein [Tissierellales bacterium]
MKDKKLLSVKDLEVTFKTKDGNIKAVNNVSFEIGKKEIVA